MDKLQLRLLIILGPALCTALLLYHMTSTAGRFGGYAFLGAVIGFEVVVFAVWEYRSRFFVLLMLVFLLAGLQWLSHGVWLTARWFVLAVGAAVGFILYIREKHYSFGVFHLIALACVLSAIVSALVSPYPQVALLKTGSLALLFIYAASGARLAICGREARFFSMMLLGMEILVYFTAGCYFVLHYPIYGNPNSMGAVMGVAAAPILLWGVLISEGTPVWRRRMFALLICLALLFSSYARAAIAGALVSSLLLCFALRRYRLLAKGAILALVLATVVVVRAPVPTGASDSLVSAYIYKGKPHTELLESREGRWDWTMWVIRRHPWFGSGFGTSPSIVEVQQKTGAYASTEATSREHGSSYLAILEWMGMFGVVPFGVLLVVVAGYAMRAFWWARRTASPFSPAIPIAAVIISGLIHAAFEDWMFAVGYYICVFFWSLAFVLVDVTPNASAPAPAPARVAFAARPWPGGYSAPDPGR